MGKRGSKGIRRGKRRTEQRPEVNGFSWVIAGKLAGMGLPGWPFSDQAADLESLKGAGIGAVVTLTEYALESDAVETSGLEVLHLPIPDMTPPSREDIEQFTHFVDEALSADKPVAAHCLAGRGRTGTMLACYLVKQGLDAAAAIAQIREQRPGSIETQEQVMAVFDYARYLKEKILQE